MNPSDGAAKTVPPVGGQSGMTAGANQQRPLREDLKVQKLMKRVEMQLAREAKTKQETSQASPTKN